MINEKAYNNHLTRQLFSLLSQNTGEWSVKKAINRKPGKPGFSFTSKI